jgi:hypothetical protein
MSWRGPSVDRAALSRLFSAVAAQRPPLCARCALSELAPLIWVAA